MFRILDSKNGLPSYFEVDKDAKFQPGQIACFKRNNEGNIVCGVSDGIYCAGIIDDIKSDFDDTTLGSGKVCVWNVKNLIAETDQFSFGDLTNGTMLIHGQPLYISKYGMLTHLPQANFLRPVAEFQKLASPFLTFKWLRKKY